MNKKKWIKENRLERLVTKLTEECGEVAKAFLDMDEGSLEDQLALTDHLVEELDHVIFIASCARFIADVRRKGLT